MTPADRPTGITEATRERQQAVPEPPTIPDVPHAAKWPGRLGHILGQLNLQSAVLVAILVLLVFYTLHFARPILVPITIAVLLNLLLSPLVGRLKRLMLPEPAGAALVLLGFAALLGWGVYGLSGPAADWVAQAPRMLQRVEEKLEFLKGPVETVQEATEKVEELADVAQDQGRPLVRVEQTGLGAYFVIGTGSLLTQALVVVVLAYFLLASGDLFMRRLVRIMSTGDEKRRVVEIVRVMQRDVSTYLGTVTLINAGLGAVTALTMHLLDMPNPVLWGVSAGLLNFIPYLGSATMIAVLALVGLLTFETVGYALVPPAVFFAFTTIEANLVTPVLLGRRLTLNPALVFLSLVVWTWLWGIPGAILAVPLLVAFKTFADHLEGWHGISVFLGRRDS